MLILGRFPGMRVAFDFSWTENSAIGMLHRHWMGCKVQGCRHIGTFVAGSYEVDDVSNAVAIGEV